MSSLRGTTFKKKLLNICNASLGHTSEKNDTFPDLVLPAVDIFLV